MPRAPTPSHEESRWDPLVISLVAAICIIFLLISYSKILKQICCLITGLIFYRNRDQRQRLNEDTNANDSSLDFYGHGLASSIIHSLPITQFNTNKEQAKEQDRVLCNSECGVCLGEFVDGDWLKHLPNCSHAFHVACIDTWFQTRSNCALCRSNVAAFTFPHECSVSMYPVLAALRREDISRERATATHYQILRAAVLRSPSLIYE